MKAHAERQREASKPTRGLVCRSCGHHRFQVIYTRPSDGKIVRRRACRSCGTRITTWERGIGQGVM